MADSRFDDVEFADESSGDEHGPVDAPPPVPSGAFKEDESGLSQQQTIALDPVYAYYKDGAAARPVKCTMEELLQMHDEGRLDGGHFVWTETDDEWRTMEVRKKSSLPLMTRY